jgi:hypothetical protein
MLEKGQILTLILLLYSVSYILSVKPSQKGMLCSFHHRLIVGQDWSKTKIVSQHDVTVFRSSVLVSRELPGVTN